MQQYKGIVSAGHIEFDDLFQIGMIGMLKAYEKYDPAQFENVNKFSTYGIPMIHGEIRRFLRDFNPIKVSRRYKEILRKMKQEEMLELPVQEIAARLGVSEKAVHEALKLRNLQLTSMDEEILNSDRKVITLHDQVPVSADYTGVLIHEFLEMLSERERTIIELRSWGATQMEIAEVVGIGQVQVSRILTKMKNKYLAYCSEEKVSPAIERQQKVTRERYEVMVAEGKTKKEIAQELGCHIKTLEHHQRKWKQAEKVVELYEVTV